MIEGVVISGQPTDGQLMEAERVAVLSLSPLPRAEIVKELLRLQVKTSSRNMDETRAELQLEVYADELERYPADCVLLALKLAGSEKWWPEWETLERTLSPLDATRKTLLRGIRQRLSLVGRDHQRGQMSSFGDLMKAEG
ncbi:hypothetical protein [Kiloniella antarctica]|uniref:Uncharacterized protein n=1 Tax=Kiloniella antarctica TaxID=1550907 RepID=A0ABW5BKH1_9PROT